MQTIQDILSKYGNDTVNIIRSNMDRAGQNATGDTARGLQSQLIADNRVQVSGDAHIWVLEKGRSPYKGGPKANPPLISRLERWMKAKGLQGSAWAIYQKIQREGTLLYRMGGRTDIITPALSDDRVDQVVKEVADFKTKVLADAWL